MDLNKIYCCYRTVLFIVHIKTGESKLPKVVILQLTRNLRALQLKETIKFI